MYIVKITFKRIQEFLFAVPRLKAMIGANALLGETIRNELVDLVGSNGANLDSYNPPGKDDDDPLTGSAHPDDPKALYGKGVLSRDGGHFHAVFKDEAAAQGFIHQAEATIARNLPGVRMEASVQPLNGGSSAAHGAAGQARKFAWGESDTRLPPFQICQDTGNRVANHYRANENPPYVSDLVTTLEARGKAFYEGKTEEIIGLLWKNNKLPSLDEDPRIPADLSELAGANGYIAVIHADGNAMGVRRALYAGNRDAADKDAFMTHEVKNETFFHAMRVAVRKAVVEALNKVFTPNVLQESAKLPYQVLMLGGDDLLLVTRPEYAFPFVIAYAEALKEHPIPFKDDEKRPMSIGAGIAIASHKLPFHHLYDLAESLAGSAKKLYRAQMGDADGAVPERSVVDWMVSTASWVDDVEQARRRHNVREADGECLCTSAKPYFVLPEEAGKGGGFDLETLFKQARELVGIYTSEERDQREDRDKLARSKMKRILHAVSQFDVQQSDDLFKNMDGLPKTLDAAFGKESLWQELDGNRKLTRFGDFMELVEIHYLGRKKKAQDREWMAAHNQGGDQ